MDMKKLSLVLGVAALTLAVAIVAFAITPKPRKGWELSPKNPRKAAENSLSQLQKAFADSDLADLGLNLAKLRDARIGQDSLPIYTLAGLLKENSGTPEALAKKISDSHAILYQIEASNGSILTSVRVQQNLKDKRWFTARIGERNLIERIARSREIMRKTPGIGKEYRLLMVPEVQKYFIASGTGDYKSMYLLPAAGTLFGSDTSFAAPLPSEQVFSMISAEAKSLLPFPAYPGKVPPYPRKE